ncbi:serine/threonine-protein kinase [Streptomyces johnsoniae]|uniref:non-specific serine/threonine protein kinase n=1 Tax=Streptomyces johnsoniae TaxID=3075532 RepID=A0ABU2RXH7_9ACTN|nr:serine/threonine-protein kinase [Streptomyces sp. DSM 41886]MDT0441447.1 serine/threonine-protein kinase [Streptomyces sp. DSM 41886]
MEAEASGPPTWVAVLLIAAMLALFVVLPLVFLYRQRRARATAQAPTVTAPQPQPQPPPPPYARPHASSARTATVPDAGAVTLPAGRFTLLEELGRGGMGVVWRAKDNVLGRHVAIKQLLPPTTLSSDARGHLRARMLREARAAAQIDHGNAVTVHDVLVDQDSVLIVMELVKAATLDSTVQSGGPLPPARVAAIGLGMLDVLTEAHRLGVVHRDVKPANVLVRPDGSIKLADFGIARFEGDPTLTEAGAIIGTPASMAPEQIRGLESTPATDLWGLGITLFYAVEGQPAFAGPSPTAAMAAVLTDPPRTPRRAGSALEPLLVGLLAKEPKDRPTAARVRAELADLTRNP